MNKRLYAIIFVTLNLTLFFYSNCFAVETNNLKSKSSVSEKVEISINNQASPVKLSLDEANKIKDMFLKIEENFEGVKKINEQINILKKINIIPSNFTLYTLISAINQYNTKLLQFSN